MQTDFFFIQLQAFVLPLVRLGKKEEALQEHVKILASFLMSFPMPPEETSVTNVIKLQDLRGNCGKINLLRFAKVLRQKLFN